MRQPQNGLNHYNETDKRLRSRMVPYTPHVLFPLFQYTVYQFLVYFV